MKKPWLALSVRAFRLGLDGFALYECVEITLLAARGSFFVDECQALFVKLFKPIVPRDFFEFFVAGSGSAWEFEADDADVAVAAGSLYASWFGTSLFCPAADYFVVRGYLGHVACH